MTEYPAFRPWWLGGDRWLFDEELDVLLDVARRRGEARRRANQNSGSGGRRARRRGRRGR